ncbi:hypothetical protein MLD38_009972 [Melastoma candidum]|uniref:Uncharacterized protein n=1 Tax=Melastoma candidum TaxID=119954 RepID=A0ACB9QYW3_9MYRT|nr:hypothetical protein MLD38_009972 [Melastoma candidum]
MGTDHGRDVPEYHRAKGPPYQPPHKRLSPAEMEEKRMKGLCFWCDEKYTFNHKCNNRRLFVLHWIRRKWRWMGQNWLKWKKW